ncbi:uncharacterized protein LOC117648339 [Thrips palmi]|uniref:Uncharacterized protein LOC117648339 n=1 Tax=Thrips palmi TaxID=161013 RepID=A0A6P8Z8D4_THRPL|nr:uncharacterized protein LOC117648339 [Thrips palmi]XP_034246714.1 uncharacterized protein LOC117648339 [Thrips palmi]XP_034246715.1 uncharacterized protein LOC117648339 [Thrips palmi]XP_034246716.1 uncharacterized protein LOC117648339 [Thrips palmi]XP_034246717.1 uncharacterized protein LOC117648339 [Thrips palmi]XP_034246718.1 uncharacterized protein LOC117648339 [Thrips palmi]XP_034246719.1 uncharacterized protein LOC117648339 [Thrips palmi]XP_034246720.1 uncharacterized protein LOC1176
MAECPEPFVSRDAAFESLKAEYEALASRPGFQILPRTTDVPRERDHAVYGINCLLEAKDAALLCYDAVRKDDDDGKTSWQLSFVRAYPDRQQLKGQGPEFFNGLFAVLGDVICCRDELKVQM